MSWRGTTLAVTGELRSLGRRGRIALILVAVVATAGLVAGSEVRHTVGQRWDDAFEEANGAHVAVWSADRPTVEAIARDKRVAQASHPYRALYGAFIQTQRGQGEGTIREIADGDLPPVARPLLREGRWARTAGDVVIDRSFARARGLHVGDGLRVLRGSSNAEFTVVGVAIDLLDCFYPQCDPTPLWLAPEGFQRLDANGVNYGVFLRLHDPSLPSLFTSEMLEAHSDLGVQDWVDTRHDAVTTSQLVSTLLSAIGAFVLLSASLVVASTMSARVLARRRQIGLLKVVGMRPALVSLTIVSAYAALTFVGVIVGWLLGAFLAPHLQLEVGATLGAAGVPLSVDRLLSSLVVVEALVIVSTVLPAWRASRNSVAQLVAPPTPATTKVVLPTAPLGSLRTLTGRIAIGRPLRALLAGVALAAGVVAGYVLVGADRTADRIAQDPSVFGEPQDLSVVPTGMPAREVAATLDATSGVASWLATYGDTGVVASRRIAVHVVDGDLTQSGYQLGQGRYPKQPGEVIVGYGFLKDLRVHVGDRINLDLHGESLSLKITGWYNEAEDNGRLIQLPASNLGRHQRGEIAGQFLVRVRPTTSAAEVSASLSQSLGDRVRLIEPKPIEVDVQSFRPVIWLLLAVLLAIALTNLAAAAVLAVRERHHDLAILRTVGATPRQTVGILVGATSLVASAATVLGLTIGWVAYRALDSWIGDEYGISAHLLSNPDPARIGLLSILCLASAAAIGALAVRSAATGRPAPAVRTE